MEPSFKLTWVGTTTADIRGRMVVELYRGLFAKGRNSFVWRGQDSNGWPVASGVYYVKANTDVKSFTHKLLLLK